MQFFSEIYSAYYLAVSKILGYKNISEKEAGKIIRGTAFSESEFFMMPEIKSDKTWRFLSYEKSEIKSLLKNKPVSVLTYLQKSWIKSILEDEKAVLFLDDGERIELQNKLQDIPLIYNNKNYRYSDRHKNGDNFSDENYIRNFRVILEALRTEKTVKIEYNTSWGTRRHHYYRPLRFQFSPVNNRLRVFVAEIKDEKFYRMSTINIARIVTAEIAEKYQNFSAGNADEIISERRCREPIKLKIFPERNCVERFMMEFACFEKNTELDEKTGICSAEIYYDYDDETEILIKLLAFGPVIKVEAASHFLEEFTGRIKKQMEFLNINNT